MSEATDFLPLDKTLSLLKRTLLSNKHRDPNEICHCFHHISMYTNETNNQFNSFNSFFFNTQERVTYCRAYQLAELPC